MSLDLTPSNGAVVETVRSLRLTRLFGDQLTPQWKELLQPAIEVGLGEAGLNPATVELAYFSLKAGVLRAYVIEAELSEGKSALGSLIVGRNLDSVSLASTLHIWSLYANNSISLPEWHTILGDLQRVAQEMGCGSVTAQTSNPRVIEIVESLGGRVEATLLRLEV